MKRDHVNPGSFRRRHDALEDGAVQVVENFQAAPT
jgi:hypothetical protein